MRSIANSWTSSKWSIDMSKSYYSTIFEQPADDVWGAIRDFKNYPVWVDGAGESEIEAGKSGDSVGAVRNVLYKGIRRRQKLLALSDIDRTQTYEFCQRAANPHAEFPGDAARNARHRRRPCVRRMVGDIRLRPGPSQKSALSFFAMRLRIGWNRCGVTSRVKRSHRLRHLAQLEFLDLAGARLRDVRKDDVARAFVGGQMLAAPLH